MYVFTLDTAIISMKGAMGVGTGKVRFDNVEDAKKTTLLREQMIAFVTKDMLKMGKEVKGSDFIIDTKQHRTTYILTTDSIAANVYLQPPMLEVYAYHKINRIDVFSYPYEKLLFNNVEVFKLKVKC